MNIKIYNDIIINEIHECLYFVHSTNYFFCEVSYSLECEIFDTITEVVEKIIDAVRIYNNFIEIPKGTIEYDRLIKYVTSFIIQETTQNSLKKLKKHETHIITRIIRETYNKYQEEIYNWLLVPL